MQRCGGEEGTKEISREMEGACVRYLRQLLGKINYVLQVNPEDAEFCRAKELAREMLAARSCPADFSDAKELQKNK